MREREGENLREREISDEGAPFPLPVVLPLAIAPRAQADYWQDVWIKNTSFHFTFQQNTSFLGGGGDNQKGTRGGRSCVA